jgi:hypothetical protein
MTVRNPTAFFEKLLELEWPDRSVAVTAAPFDPVDAAPLDDPRSFEVLDVTVGPELPRGAELPGDTAFAHFRIVLADPLRRHDWVGAASILLVTARQKLEEFRRAAAAHKR